MFMCNFLAAGPSVAIVETALDFFPPVNGPSGITHAIHETAYFFTTTALIQGTGNLFWMPLVNKYGRRPVYIASFALYLGVALWLSFTTGYTSFLIARILMGFASGAAEAMAPLSIADGRPSSLKPTKHAADFSSIFLTRTWSSHGVRKFLALKMTTTDRY